MNSRELFTYTALGHDGAAGAIRDCLVEDNAWSVKYIVVDTEGVLSDNKVILAVGGVENVDPLEQAVVFSLSKSDMERSTPADLAPPVSLHHNCPEVSGGAVHDPNLRSAVELGKYSVSASDGRLGEVTGFIIEIATWIIRYVVVDTGEMFTSRQILLAPAAICRIDWEAREMSTELTISAVRACPEYDQEGEITRQYEAFLHSYYGWQPYWNST